MVQNTDARVSVVAAVDAANADSPGVVVAANGFQFRDEARMPENEIKLPNDDVCREINRFVNAGESISESVAARALGEIAALRAALTAATTRAVLSTQRSEDALDKRIFDRAFEVFRGESDEATALREAYRLGAHTFAREHPQGALPAEVDALIDEALTFSHQDCGSRDAGGYGCIRCAAESADMRRKSHDSFLQTMQQAQSEVVASENQEIERILEAADDNNRYDGEEAIEAIVEDRILPDLKTLADAYRRLREVATRIAQRGTEAARQGEVLQGVEIHDGKAYIIGIPAPRREQEEMAGEGHNCGEMGCPSASAHTLYILPLDGAEQRYREATVDEVRRAWAAELVGESGNRLRDGSPTVTGLMDLLRQAGLRIARA